MTVELDKVISALNSETRRQILEILAKGHGTVEEVWKKLGQRGIAIKYRVSVYKALEKLVDTDLVEKFYDKDKGMCYKLLIRTIKIDVAEGTIKSIE